MQKQDRQSDLSERLIFDDFSSIVTKDAHGILSIRVKPGMTIETLKSIIEYASGMPRTRQEVVVSGIAQRNDKTLTGAGVRPGMVVHAFTRSKKTQIEMEEARERLRIERAWRVRMASLQDEKKPSQPLAWHDGLHEDLAAFCYDKGEHFPPPS